MRRVDGSMPRANDARGKVRGALPRTPARGTPLRPPARFPFCPMFQNGPRRQGFASPRTHREPLTAPGRSEDGSMRRESGQTQTLLRSRLCAASRWSAPSCTTTLE